MNDIEIIRSKIYEIRGQKVMLDRDLAEMYGVETRALNQAVKRNVDRFPEDFMFQMTSEEVEIWKSQIVMSNSVKMGIRRNPHVFTELGVAMLSSVLTSKIAIQVNMSIMRAFVSVRQMITAYPMAMRLATLEKNFEELKQDLEDIFSDYNDINEDTRAQLDAINIALADLQTTHKKNTTRKRIGFNTND
ncbi:MAG: ORF6N domain-containing protein [Muribaculaceae bacterium]|nr:ORF6N domain-containing protein [Muribaculaceae bacterium]